MAPHSTTPYINGDVNGVTNGYHLPVDPAPVDSYDTAPVHPTATRRSIPVIINSPTSQFTDEHITSKFEYRGADVVATENSIQVTPTVSNFEFRTERNVQKTG